jgi:hypothetical protein
MDKKNIEPTLKQQVLSNLLENQRQRKVNKSYLNSTFAEDFRRAQGELLTILNELNL